MGQESIEVRAVLGAFAVVAIYRIGTTLRPRTRTAEQWEEWAADRDLPLAAVKDVEQDETTSTSE